MNLDDFNEIFNILISIYPNTKNVEEVSTAYFLALGSELTKDEFLNAITKILKTRKGDFLPKPAEIIEIAREKMKVETQLIYAKRLLKTAIIRHGRTGIISFADKGVHAVIDYIGWLRLLNMSEIEFENFLNFQFDGIYKDFMKNPYITSDYFNGTSQLIGQKTPIMVTYESIGVNPTKLEFIELEYKLHSKKEVLISNVENLKKKMLLGG